MLIESCDLPKISIVSPSFNQGVFLEDTILSILNQGYSNLEYVIIDGGSSDDSIDIIKKHENRLTYWGSEQDEGQYHAINKGFSHATGEVMAWLNSDDMYLPWTLQCVGEIFASYPEVEWLTSCFPMSSNQQGVPVYCRSVDAGFSRDGFLQGQNFAGGDWPNQGYIQQESTFWRRELWEKTGGRLNENFELAADFELWARFFEYADLIGVEVPLALFRNQPAQRSSVRVQDYISECHAILKQYGGGVPHPTGRYFRRKISNFFVGKSRKSSTCLKYREGEGWVLFNK